MSLLALMVMIISGVQINLNVEPARGQNGGTVRAVVQFTEDDFLFVMENSAETAFWEIVVSVDGDLIARNSGSVVRSELPGTEELSIPGIQPGIHRLAVTIRDLESGRNTEREETIEVFSLDSTSWLSENLQVSGGLSQRASGTVQVVWNVYPPIAENDDSLMAAFALKNESGETLREGWMDMVMHGSAYRVETSLDIGHLDAGKYYLLAAAVSDTEVVTDSRTVLQLYQAWDIWGENADLTETLVRPIAHSSELSALRNAEGQSSRRAVMAEFWHRRDPSPGTVRNEFLEMYLARLDNIEEKFTMLNTMGINTDQGRVYALLGEPDIIDSRPLETSTLPTQVWTYCSPAIEVYFIDHDNCGVFELATDWEEVQSIYEGH